MTEPEWPTENGVGSAGILSQLVLHSLTPLDRTLIPHCHQYPAQQHEADARVDVPQQRPCRRVGRNINFVAVARGQSALHAEPVYHYLDPLMTEQAGVLAQAGPDCLK